MNKRVWALFAIIAVVAISFATTVGIRHFRHAQHRAAFQRLITEGLAQSSVTFPIVLGGKTPIQRIPPEAERFAKANRDLIVKIKTSEEASEFADVRDLYVSLLTAQSNLCTRVAEGELFEKKRLDQMLNERYSDDCANTRIERDINADVSEQWELLRTLEQRFTTESAKSQPYKPFLAEFDQQVAKYHSPADSAERLTRKPWCKEGGGSF